MRTALRQATLCGMLMSATLESSAAAQGRGKAKPRPVAASPSAVGTTGADSLNNLKFRNLGPSVGGGRVAAVAGVPGERNVYYVGAAAGGVWKTTDGGDSWEAVFKDQPTASIGAIALAPSNPNIVWVGTGEGNPRNDVVDGRGVFMSPDAGKTWQFVGLGDVGQISRIVIDPSDPNVVLVGALGHVWAPNAERGVFRTADGGKTWQKTLFVNDTTGVADLVMVPGNPRVVFAGMWQFVRYPWELVSGGGASGIFRSTDGGLTWARLKDGLPTGPLGRIALAVGPTNPTHVYALIETKQGMLWDSKDQGDHWTKVSDNHALSARPFYFSLLHVSPVDDRKVFFSSYLLLRSDDGGKTTTPIDRGVHVDHHALWIDPQNPDRMIQGNDGGSYVTENGAKSWRYLNNLPIEQFYMVAADNNTPYMLCGGLQDNNAWCGPSTNVGGGGGSGGGGGVGGGLNGSEWFTVTGGDGEYAVPAPSDSSILYVDSQNGNITRLDLKTGQTRSIRPYLSSVNEMKPANLTYRFNWTTPIAVSPHDANTVFMGANVVFKTTDGGEHWMAISPDLTRNDKSKQVTSGGPIEYDISGAETYGTLLTVNLAPTDSNVIWAGSDDGLVHVTRDAGKTWTNVSGHFPGLASGEGRVYQIGISPFDAGTAYLAVDRHELDDHHPYVYKTADYGKTWADIGKGLPADVPAHVVREDPNQRGFLVLGTDAALWYSRDGGASWKPFKADFPTVPVYDVQFIKRTRDLVVATHGRGLFVLDNITALEELTPEVLASDFHVFSTQPTQIRVRPRRAGVAPTRFTTPNAPAGAVVDYYLKTALDTAGAATSGQRGEGDAEGAGRGRSRRGRVIATVTDSHGDTVLVDSSGPGKQGVSRYVWSLRYAGPTRLTFERSPAAEEEENPFRQVTGPRAIPGTYTIALTAGGRTEAKTVTVEPDPVLGGDAAKFAAQLHAGLEWRNALSALNEMLNRIVSLETQLKNTQQALRDNAGGDTTAVASVSRHGRDLGRKLKELKDSLYNSEVQREAGQDDIHYLNHFHDRLQSLGFGLAFAYAQPPTEVFAARFKELRATLDGYLAKFNDLLRTDVAGFNKTAEERRAPVLVAGAPIEVKEVKIVSR